MATMMNTPPDRQWQHNPLYRWWRSSIVVSVEHQSVMTRIVSESGWSARYAFMTTMSAGIAVLGLLLSSPAVVIGAMLISPLMSPILRLGFSLALFDFSETRRSLVALITGAVLAVAFTAIIVLASPLKAPTAEILARTPRPSGASHPTKPSAKHGQTSRPGSSQIRTIKPWDQTARHVRSRASRRPSSGKYRGRPISIYPGRVKALKQTGMGAAQIAKTMQIGRASVYRALAA